MNKNITVRLKQKKYVHAPDSKIVKIKTEINGLGLLKTLLVFLTIIFQLTILLYFYFKYVAFIKGYLIFSFIISLFACIYLLSSKKNSHSKAVWILFLLLFFSFSYILFFLSDKRIFFRTAKKRYKQILNRTKIYNDSLIFNKDFSLNEMYLNKSGDFISYQNTDTKYFPSGTLLFDDILKKLEKAEKFIFIEFFIISDGILLNRLLNILEEKVVLGVDVRIIYDDMGSHSSLSSTTKRRIKKCGIKLYPFNRLLPLISMAINYRDHRKIVIIDGKIAYTGGANLADEYINEKRMFGYWKDAGIRLKGIGVDGFTLIFLRQWEFITKKEEDYTPFLGMNNLIENESIVIPYADGLEYKLSVGKDMYLNVLSQAKERIFIMSPYLILEDSILSILINKAISGVEVKIILPGLSDKKIVYRITKDNAEKLIEYGVRFFLMKSSFVHSKVVLTENCAIIGSINMDLRSFYQQFESAVYITDLKTMYDIKKDFEDTFNKSNLALVNNKKRKNMFSRIYVGILRVISPFM